MTPAVLAAAQDAAVPVHLAVPAEMERAGVGDVRIGGGGPGGFAREFATADGQQVLVAARSRQQFADLAQATRLAGTFAFLERLLGADFSARADLHAHRAAIAALLAPWFSRRTVADLAAAFAGTSVPWAHLHALTARPGSDAEAAETNGHRAR